MLSIFFVTQTSNQTSHQTTCYGSWRKQGRKKWSGTLTYEIETIYFYFRVQSWTEHFTTNCDFIVLLQVNEISLTVNEFY